MRMHLQANLPYIVVPHSALTIHMSLIICGVNVVAPLTTSTKEERCTVIQFLWAEGVRDVEIHQRLSAQCGDSVLPQ